MKTFLLLNMFILASRSNVFNEEIKQWQMTADRAEIFLAAMDRNNEDNFYPDFNWNCHYRLVDHLMICTKPKEVWSVEEVTIPPPAPPPTLSIYLSQEFLEMDSASE